MTQFGKLRSSRGAARLFLERAKRNWRSTLAGALFILAFCVFIFLNPRGLSVTTLTPWANQVTSLAFAAVAQFCTVVTGGLDLSVGPMIALTNALGSHVLSGSTSAISLGVLALLALGTACGLVNGVVINYVRIEPIVATLATGAVYGGAALLLRPSPGGSVDEALGDLFTYETFGVIPTSLLLLGGVLTLVWAPLWRTVVGRSLRAVRSNVSGAYMSGLRPERARLVAYSLCGFFAAWAGLFLSVQTLSGDAGVGASYTLNSIAAVVLGGASLAGGVGNVLGVVLGAAILRTVGAIVIFTSLPALAQPLFEGVVLVLAVAIGAIEFLRAPNRMATMR